MTPTSHFGRWLLARLTARNLTRPQLYARIGVSERTLGYWVAGDRQPTAAHLVAIRAALDCTGDELLNVIALDLEDAR